MALQKIKGHIVYQSWYRQPMEEAISIIDFAFYE